MKTIYSLIFLAFFAFCAFFLQRHALAIIHWTGTLGLLAPFFFLVLYCLATLLFLPTMVLTLAGGALFGPVFGVLLNLLGATLGAVFAFCISRYVVSDRFANTKHKRLKHLMLGVERRGWQCVALLRLVPIIPFNLVNYGLGVTRIKFSHYLVTTLIFLIPAEIIFTYCGYAGVNILKNPTHPWGSTSLIFLGCMGVLIGVYGLLKRYHHHFMLSE